LGPEQKQPSSVARIGGRTSVPEGLDRVAAWAWRLLVIGAALAVTGFVVWQLRGLFVPIFVALMLATQLVPFSYWMQRHGLPSAIAVVVSLLVLILILGLVTLIIVGGLVAHVDEVGAKVSEGADEATSWVASNDGPLDLDKGQAQKDASSVDSALDKAGDVLLKGIFGGISLFVQLAAGAVFALAFLIYMLADGRGIFRWIVGRFSPRVQQPVDRIGRRGWVTLGAYFRGVMAVGVFDAVMIGIGLVIVGVPLAGTLALLIFSLSFIPIAGAWISGTITVLTALATGGIEDALIVVAIVLVVQQVLDSYIVSPLVYKQQVNLHPMVTLGSVTAGTTLAGILGAFLAVPLVAMIWGMVSEAERIQAGEPADPAVVGADELGPSPPLAPGTAPASA
jgi:predicted PurR-regulated permease PerM